MTKITFIGPGVMAEAMIAGIIREGVAVAEDLSAAGPRPRRGDYLQQKYGITPFVENCEAAAQSDVIVLAIKPQTLETVMADLSGAIKPGALVISIIAGVPIKKMANGMNHTQIVRAMPNTPGRIGHGITVWTASKSVTDSQKEHAQAILTAMGQEIFMEEEKYLDMATALSGTGPAYVFMFMESMVDAGVHLGFPRRIAEELVVETMKGSVSYYLNSSESRPMHLARMRNDVTSPGGTTAAALYYLDKAGFRTAISRAIWAAYTRSQELGMDAKAHPPED